jgi:FAD/FMN-containing dehydrogenase
VPDGDSAFAHRHAQYNLSIDAGWTDPALDADAIGWARSSWDAMAPHATGGVYLNFAGLGDETGRNEVYGAHAQRLAAIRAAYDPDGIFATAADQH